jgi:hypothetical protein
VTSICGSLWIENNEILTNITGLENIDANSISGLYINDNNSLLTCEVKSICDYLASPTGDIEIHNNATGCNSQQEVEEACETISIDDHHLKSLISIFPNPAKKTISVSSESGAPFDKVMIYNQTSQKVLHVDNFTNTIDISMLRPGMYVIEVVSGELKVREKLIVK